jgi:hypothetical protein
MVSLLQNISLQEDLLDLHAVNDGILSQRLHSVNFCIRLFLDEEYLPETSSADDTLNLEMVQVDLVCFLASLVQSV